jgi:hypothetical protein
MLLPEPRRKQTDYMKFIIDRTLYFPRDVILFFNECITAAEGRTTISVANLQKAEGAYSELRLRALADEWSADYPNLLSVAFFLKKQKPMFRIDEVDKEQVENFMMEFWYKNSETQDHIYSLVEEKLGTRDIDGLMRDLFRIFYRTGIIGVKKETYLETYWSYLGHKVLEAELDSNVTYHIHPAFWRVLGVNPMTSTS